MELISDEENIYISFALSGMKLIFVFIFLSAVGQGHSRIDQKKWWGLCLNAVRRNSFFHQLICHVLWEVHGKGIAVHITLLLWGEVHVIFREIFGPNENVATCSITWVYNYIKTYYWLHISWSISWPYPSLCQCPTIANS